MNAVTIDSEQTGSRSGWHKMLFFWIALGVAVRSRPSQGQAISFMRQVDRGSTRSAVSADTTGVYVVSTGSTYILRKYDASANELWTSRFGVRHAY